MLDPINIDVVIYHKGCADGEASALCVYAINKEKDIKYIPMYHVKELPEDLIKDLTGKNVLIVDFSFPKDIMLKLKEICKDVLLIDHHKTAYDDLKDLDFCKFDLTHSAAYLVYKYCNENVDDDHVPLYIKYVEDRDLWAWKYRERSEPMYQGILHMKDTGQKNFKHLLKYLESDDEVNKVIEVGIKVMDENKKYIENVVKNVKKTMFEGKIIMLQPLTKPHMISEISEHLYTNNNVDYTVCWFGHKDNKYLGRISLQPFVNHKYVLSFRTNNNDVNVSEVAKKFGGGGHPKASGATIEMNPELVFGVKVKKPIIVYSDGTVELSKSVWGLALSGLVCLGALCCKRF